MDLSASESVPNDKEEYAEEAVPDSKLILDNLAERLLLFKAAFHFFYSMNSSMMRASNSELFGDESTETKAKVEGEVVP